MDVETYESERNMDSLSLDAYGTYYPIYLAALDVRLILSGEDLTDVGIVFPCRKCVRTYLLTRHRTGRMYDIVNFLREKKRKKTIIYLSSPHIICSINIITSS